MSIRNRIITAISMALFFVLVGTASASALWFTLNTVGATVKVATLEDSCTNVTQMLNASFEEPAINGTLGYANDGEMLGWRAKNAAGQPVRIEIWRGYDGIPAGVGAQFVELNADVPGTIFQSLTTTPGQTLQWSFLHRGRQGNDTMQLFIGAPGVLTAATSQGSFIDGTGGWTRYSGTYVVPAGQTTTELSFKAVAAAGGESIGNFLDDVSFGSGPCVTVATSVANLTTPGAVYRTGETLEYTSVINNIGSSLSLSNFFEGIIPAGLEYQANTITVDGASRTDVNTDDAVDYTAASRRIVARIGTGSGLAAGGTIAQATQTITVKYKVKVAAGTEGATYSFTPIVNYANGLAVNWGRVATSNTAAFTVAQGADLATTVTANPVTWQKVANATQNVTWTVTVTNNGPLSSGTGSSVAIAIPTNNGLTGTAVPASTGNTSACGAISGGQSVCVINPAIASGGTRVFTVTRTIPATAVFNTAYTLSAATTAVGAVDSVATNNSGSATATVVDTVAPTPPGTPAATNTATTATLTWAASTDASGIAGYDIYRAGVAAPVGSTAGNVLTFTNTGLDPWASYSYTVVARDAAGNSSVASGTRVVRTGPGTLTTTDSYKLDRDTGTEYCISGSSATAGATLIMVTGNANCNGTSDLRDWSFVVGTDGFAHLKMGSLDRFWTAPATGTVVTTTAGSTAMNQDWTVTYIAANNAYRFESRSRPGQCLERTAIAVVGLQGCDNSTPQQFTATPR